MEECKKSSKNTSYTTNYDVILVRPQLSIYFVMVDMNGKENVNQKKKKVSAIRFIIAMSR